MKNPIQSYELAARFAALLSAELTPAQLDAISDANAKETDANICHSHDHCDANVTMAQAFTEITKQEIDLQSDEQTALWNDAWRVYRLAYTSRIARALTSAGFALEHQGGGMFNWRKPVTEGIELFCCDGGGCEPDDLGACVIGLTLSGSDSLCDQEYPDGTTLARVLNSRINNPTLAPSPHAN